MVFAAAIAAAIDSCVIVTASSHTEVIPCDLLLHNGQVTTYPFPAGHPLSGTGKGYIAGLGVGGVQARFCPFCGHPMPPL